MVQEEAMDCGLGSEVLLRTPSPQFLLEISMIHCYQLQQPCQNSDDKPRLSSIAALHIPLITAHSVDKRSSYLCMLLLAQPCKVLNTLTLIQLSIQNVSENHRTPHLFKLRTHFWALLDYVVSQQEHKVLSTLCQISSSLWSKQCLLNKTTISISVIRK